MWYIFPRNHFNEWSLSFIKKTLHLFEFNFEQWISFSIQRWRPMITRYLWGLSLNVTDIIWGKGKDFLKSVNMVRHFVVLNPSYLQWTTNKYQVVYELHKGDSRDMQWTKGTTHLIIENVSLWIVNSTFYVPVVFWCRHFNVTNVRNESTEKMKFNILLLKKLNPQKLCTWFEYNNFLSRYSCAIYICLTSVTRAKPKEKMAFPT